MGDSISRQAAIDGRIIIQRSNGVEIYSDEAVPVEYLKRLPSAQPEQSSEIQDILEYLDTVLHPIVSPDHWNVYSELHDMISMLPSAQPEIIRCRDCTCGAKDEDGHWFCRGIGCQIGDHEGNGFCLDAERRTDE